jgi:hypothetical protein
MNTRRGDFWGPVDSASERFARVFTRISFQCFLVLVGGLSIYALVAFLPNDVNELFKALFYLFIALYVLFSAFAFICLLTKFQQRKVLPPRDGGLNANPGANSLYRALWSVEKLIGIDSFPFKDRYRYWSFIHYLIAVMMFLNATYCLSRAESILGPNSRFANIDALENMRYTFDLLHKGIIISEGIAHFGRYISSLPHVFRETNFESIYFFSFKIVSALLLISIFTMLFEPALSRLVLSSEKMNTKE